jgi:hypothetical protein
MQGESPLPFDKLRTSGIWIYGADRMRRPTLIQANIKEAEHMNKLANARATKRSS